MKKLLLLFLFLCSLEVAQAQPGISTAIPSEKPSKYQKDQIKRKYGMFIHFGINTFHDVEWSDGSFPVETYAPAEIDACQWVKTAKDAGMKYIILVAKHHEGFCLWDSKYTDYDVASSGNKTNVIEAVARECKRQGMKLGLYYSLWDRKVNADVDNVESDRKYNTYMLKQLDELMDITEKYTKIVEFWFDGSWVKPGYRWPVEGIYRTIKSREPQCQIGINWTIGEDADPHNPNAPEKSYKIIPEERKEGDPIRYFPSDFRLGDPYNPKNEKTVLEKRKRKVRPGRRKNENGKFPDTHTKKRQRLNVNKTVFKRCFFYAKKYSKSHCQFRENLYLYIVLERILSLITSCRKLSISLLVELFVYVLPLCPLTLFQASATWSEVYPVRKTLSGAKNSQSSLFPVRKCPLYLFRYQPKTRWPLLLLPDVCKRTLWRWLHGHRVTGWGEI